MQKWSSHILDFILVLLFRAFTIIAPNRQQGAQFVWPLTLSVAQSSGYSSQKQSLAELSDQMFHLSVCLMMLLQSYRTDMVFWDTTRWNDHLPSPPHSVTLILASHITACNWVLNTKEKFGWSWILFRRHSEGQGHMLIVSDLGN